MLSRRGTPYAREQVRRMCKEDTEAPGEGQTNNGDSTLS